MIIIDLLATSLPTVDEYMQRIITPAAGGVASFVGITRNNFNGLTVDRLEVVQFLYSLIVVSRKGGGKELTGIRCRNIAKL